MHSLVLLVATASLGVDYGWQPDEDGQLEYIIQVEPSLVELLKQGQEVVSEIHPDAQGVRRFRILVGKGSLPRIGAPTPAEPELKVETPERMTLSNDQPDPADDPASFPARPVKRRSLGGDFGFPEDPSDPSSGDSGQPDTLQPDPAKKPLVHRQVGHTERLPAGGEVTKGGEGDVIEAAGSNSSAAPAKPWLPLAVTTLLLFGSIGGNAYLGWLARDFYNRYRAMAERVRERT